MQVDAKMYLAASPPLFVSPLMGPLDVSTGRRRQPFTSSYRLRQPTTTTTVVSSLNGINSLGFDFSAMTLSPALMRSAAAAGSIGRRNSPLTCSQIRGASVVANAPLRSCLVVRTDAAESPSSPQEDAAISEPSSPVSEDAAEPASPTKLKKRVVFADAKGLSLTQVKMMTEPSDCPPRWTAEFLEQVTGGASAEVAADRWELTFAQPACDYLDFRSRLDKQNISLENVLVQEADQQLVGTVKVKNLSFSKQVTIRVTFDNWATQTDVEATFVPSGPQGATSLAAINLFDTFSFKISIPVVVPSNRIQFCIRFKSDAGEFWDNNMGKNYVVIKPIIESIKISGTNPALSLNNAGFINGLTANSRRAVSGKYSDLMSPNSKIDYWAEFASWNHLVNDSPYW
jgi:protein phosphatase 1 regulatory subunit 3A/B/C/D/E